MNRIKLATIVIALLAATAVGQVATTHTTGLTTPNKIIKGPSGSLIVTEAGTTTANTGRISIVDRTTGARHTLISGLPSAVSFLGGPQGDPSGPAGLYLLGRVLWITIGVGDSVLPGPAPGLETPNPNPSSPLFNAVLELRLPRDFTELSSPFVMTPANQQTLDTTGNVTLTNAQGISLRIRLVVDLPDWRANPLPGQPNNVKASNLFGIEWLLLHVYVVDAGHNEIKRVNLFNGDTDVFVAFPPRPNPGPGPPFIDHVPTNIRRVGLRFLVPNLTGFPFIPGAAEVRRINIWNAQNEPFITGLTSAMDIVSFYDFDDSSLGLEEGDAESEGKSDADAAGSKAENSGADVMDSRNVTFGRAYYTLEFSTNMLGGAPGRLRFYSSPSSPPVDLLTNLITPTSMALDYHTGNLFITNIGPGTITKVTFP